MATNAQVKAFFEKIGPLARQVCIERGYGNAQLWTCMCQAACESAYGTAGLMVRAHAYFGVKATSGWVKAAKYGGLVCNSATKECYDGKTYTNITACFRAYSSDIDSIRDYFDLLEMNRYKASLSASSVEQCITLIKNGGYATSPTYIKTIMSIYRSFLTQIERYKVDSVPTPAPAPAEYTITQLHEDICKWAKVETVEQAEVKLPTISQSTNNHIGLVTFLERYFKSIGYYSGPIEVDMGKTPSFGLGMSAALEKYQKNVVGMKHPDRVITGYSKNRKRAGYTWRKLLGL